MFKETSGIGVEMTDRVFRSPAMACCLA